MDNKEIDAFCEETNDLAILPMFLNGTVIAEVKNLISDEDSLDKINSSFQEKTVRTKIRLR